MSWGLQMSKDLLTGDGFAVRLPGRSGLQYSENGRTMTIDAEMLAGPVDLIVYRSSVGLWSDGMVANDSEKRRILANIEAALAKAGIKAEFE